MRLTRWFRAYVRFIRVTVLFLPFVFAYLRDRHRFLLFGQGRTVGPDARRERAERLLDSLISLGPTFIKLGQLLSTRPDILPPIYIDVLSRLQDDVPPAPWEEARVVIESELGPLDEHFDSFDTSAISGASLGQVYRAEVDEQPVAVKVRRPNVEQLVETDLLAIRWTLWFVLPFIDDARAFSVRNLADEFAKTIRQEMDYHREAAMLEEIRANFLDHRSIVIPPVVGSHSSERVLTMEYIGGTKITDVDRLTEQGIDRTEVARQLQHAYFKMIIDDGVFHADPHPGNLAVKPDGTIVFYDFGMSGRVDTYLQDKIIEFYVGVINRDIDSILDSLIEVGTLSPEADRAIMGEVMEVAIEDARGHEVEQYRVQEIVRQVEESIYEFPFRLPANLALILRVATVVEGVCITLDPSYDFVAVASEYLQEQGYHQQSIERFARETRDDLIDAATASIRVPPKLESALDRIEHENLRVEANVRDHNRVLARLGRRLVIGMILASSILATAILYTFADIYATLVGVGVTLILLVLIYRSFQKRRGIRARPQFTRQSLYRQRERE